MKKVYCSTCTHLCFEKDLKKRDLIKFSNNTRSPITPVTKLCSADSVLEEWWEEDPIEHRKRRAIVVADPFVSNKNNDCKKYERSTSKSVKAILDRIFPKT